MMVFPEDGVLGKSAIFPLPSFVKRHRLPAKFPDRVEIEHI